MDPTSPSSSGRKRTAVKYSAEDQALNTIAREAEARLAARRAARAEAREIRMKELEKQQKDAPTPTSEEKQDRHFELMNEHRPTPRVYTKLPSPDESEDAKELRKELTELEDKYKRAMMTNAQLDNEKQTYRYQVDLHKDQLEDMEEQLIELQRLHKDTCRELDKQKRDYKDLQFENGCLKEQLQQRDKLIEEYGLVFVSNETMGEIGGGAPALLTPEAAQILHKGEGSLEDRLRSFADDKERLEEEVRKLKQQLEEEREKNALAERYSSPKPAAKVNGPDMQLLEVQMEAQRQVQDYKFKLKKAEQDITTLEGNVLRLESQAKRYKQAADNSEKVEEELKAEKRKMQRELREAQNTIEEIQTQNHHLSKRLEKIRSARNAVLKP